ncbi:hypothetical protein EG328_000646 [Venturia inaequalis]|uniref:Uncharacterized protein n=1 Tax=Venturia inaequalis TaxID=5025 RepID=A0A8H3V2B6_VENIN|nr:hypothetical protein EG328_000646 [Venturia inaequalis]
MNMQGRHGHGFSAPGDGGFGRRAEGDGRHGYGPFGRGRRGLDGFTLGAGFEDDFGGSGGLGGREYGAQRGLGDGSLESEILESEILEEKTLQNKNSDAKYMKEQDWDSQNSDALREETLEDLVLEGRQYWGEWRIHGARDWDVVEDYTEINPGIEILCERGGDDNGEVMYRSLTTGRSV